ncbi:phosphotransferase family protein [Streptomyces sp. N35]|uniref:phosphotransferase family protein n=1 Tax=Streptomyces sp. N35 TaxID=2795730 RepID=UPI001F1C625A|nr:phosphotransferase [Streptomyces sp. N35]
MPQPPIPLRRLHALGAIRTSLAHASALPGPALAALQARADQIEAALDEVSYELPEAVLHGDPQHGNALHHARGAVLCDWDSAALGPPEWDLVTVEVHCRRFGYEPADYARFAAHYGWDVSKWDGHPALRDLRELRMISTNSRKASHSLRTLPEVLRRIEVLHDARGVGGWSIL